MSRRLRLALSLLMPLSCAQEAQLAERALTANCQLTDPCQTASRFDTAQGRCVFDSLPDGTPCDDHDVCTANTTCQSGSCQGTRRACPARGPCFLDNACDPNLGCIDVPLEGPCVPGLGALTLAGCSSADYTAPITLGGRTMSLIIDSGSTTTAVASSGCTEGCEGLSPVYDLAHADRTSAAPVPADSQYGDGSAWSGELVTDVIAAGSLTPSLPYTFAAMTWASPDNPPKTSAFFVPDRCSGTPIDNTRQGIFGLAGAQLASPGATTFMDALAATGTTDAFATQFCNTTGRLWLGGYDPAYIASAVSFVPMDASDGFYRITLADILVDGVSLGLTPDMFGGTSGRPIVDNGTSIMSFPAAVAERIVDSLAGNAKFVAQFPASMFFTDPACLTPKATDATRAELNAMLPTMTLVIAGAAGQDPLHLDLAPTASYLTYTLLAAGGAYCPSVGNSGEDPHLDDDATILGNSMMREHVLVFDRAGGRLGFAQQTQCFAPDF